MVRHSWLTPLCPAGHLPHKGGDRIAAIYRPYQTSRLGLCGRVLPISLLVGEMPGRAEEGIAPPTDLAVSPEAHP
ncbi:lytic murein transglycosylase [Agrobacterium larrymoorei]|uniref:Lytic murein transglycosylase n=1 Tax=Agrobacterium larrymoorei TaxID=160699 RepID=A0A4D7DLP4_9HYPH|nr:lytic murein transglycosylase [Agrobacterium larrymoorei]